MFLLKNNYNRETDIRYLKPLYIVANLLGLAPCYNFNNNKPSYPFWYKICGILNLLILLTIYMRFFITGIVKYRKYMTDTELIVDNLEYFLLNFFNVYTVLASFTFKKKYWFLLLKTFNSIDGLLKRKPNNNGSWFPLEFILFNIVMLCIFGMEMGIWFSYNVNTYFYYIFMRLQFYHIFLFVFLICLLSKNILIRYEYFNGILLEELYKLQMENWTCRTLNVLLELKLENLLMIYEHLTVLIQCFNDVFGWILLIFNGVIIMECLECINLILLSLFLNTAQNACWLSLPVSSLTLCLMVSFKNLSRVFSLTGVRGVQKV